jgi:hypothetical protein
VLPHAGEDAGATRAERARDFREQRRFAERFSGDNEGALEIATLKFGAQGFDFSRAGDYAFKAREVEFAD